MTNFYENYDMSEEKTENTGDSDNIKLCAGGKYRWIYEFSMMKNTTIFFTILKIFMIGGCTPALVTLFSSLGREKLGAFVTCAKVYGVIMSITVPLTFFAYLIVAAMYGWKYIVLFEMDNKGIVHIQQDKQFKKAQGVAWLATLSDRSGRGISVSTKNSQSSNFRSVRIVKGIRSRNTIKLNQFLVYNQIYVENEDYDFVWEFITARCKKAKIK